MVEMETEVEMATEVDKDTATIVADGKMINKDL